MKKTAGYLSLLLCAALLPLHAETAPGADALKGFREYALFLVDRLAPESLTPELASALVGLGQAEKAARLSVRAKDRGLASNLLVAVASALGARGDMDKVASLAKTVAADQETTDRMYAAAAEGPWAPVDFGKALSLANAVKGYRSASLRASVLSAGIQRGRSAEALAALEAMKKDESFPDIASVVCGAFAQAGDFKNALALLSDVPEGWERDGAKSAVAMAYAGKGMLAEAAKLAGSDDAVLIVLAEKFAALGRKQESEDAFAKASAASLAVDHPYFRAKAFSRIAAAYARLGQTDMALKVIKEELDTPWYVGEAVAAMAETAKQPFLDRLAELLRTSGAEGPEGPAAVAGRLADLGLLVPALRMLALVSSDGDRDAVRMPIAKALAAQGAFELAVLVRDSMASDKARAAATKLILDLAAKAKRLCDVPGNVSSTMDGEAACLLDVDRAAELYASKPKYGTAPVGASETAADRAAETAFTRILTTEVTEARTRLLLLASVRLASVQAEIPAGVKALLAQAP